MFDDLMHKDPWKVHSVAKYTPSVNGHITCMKMSEVLHNYSGIQSDTL